MSKSKKNAHDTGKVLKVIDGPAFCETIREDAVNGISHTTLARLLFEYAVDHLIEKGGKPEARMNVFTYDLKKRRYRQLGSDYERRWTPSHAPTPEAAVDRAVAHLERAVKEAEAELAEARARLRAAKSRAPGILKEFAFVTEALRKAATS